ncbi:MAG: hypothetical protein AAGC86_09230 [Pseudomonadota bacterium]
MKHLTRSSSLAACLVAVCTIGHAAEPALDGAWPAVSKTAMSITGDITVTDRALEFEDGQKIAWAFQATRTANWADLGEEAEGAIYRVTVPSDPTLVRGNSFCGWPVTWIVLSRDPYDGLAMTVFYGEAMPSRFADDKVCAVYSYGR